MTHTCPRCGVEILEEVPLEGGVPDYRERNGAVLTLSPQAPRVACPCGEVIILIKGGV